MAKNEPIKDHTEHYPKIQVDWDQMDRLLAIHCTLVEVADYFGCSEDTIENRVKEAHGITFSEYRVKKTSGGKRSLRRRQYEAAMAGNPTMMIWLGKQWLNQTDKQEISGNQEKPVQLAYNLEEDE